jgi:type I restriction enzyme, S subunit
VSIEFYRAAGDWTPLRLGRVGWFLAGAGFPHEFQGVEGAELPFFKVGDTNLPGNERELRSAPNTVSRLTARQLGARICPAGAIAFPKVGATLLGNKRRLTVRDCLFDNNMMALVPTAEHDPTFLLYALGNLDFGQLSNPGPVPSINAGDLRDVLVPLPAPRIQRALANFLDRKTAAIDALIAKKERLIELLQEKRQALITQAVTKGLDPNVPMKDSGVEWLGKVPKHWEVRPLKRVLFYGPKNGISPPSTDSFGVPSFSISAVRSGRVDVLNNLKNVALTTLEACAYQMRKRDVLLVRGNGNLGMVGACGLVDEFPEGCTYPDILMLMRPSRAALPEFFVAAINSPYVRAQIEVSAQTSNGTYKVSGSDVRNLLLVVPPMVEQRAIADAVASLDRTIGTPLSCVRLQTEKLREYRQELNTAAVTGKIDVSAEAA